MNLTSTALILIVFVCSLIMIYIIIYLIASCIHGREILVSTPSTEENSFEEGDFFYYLPMAVVSVTATATVSVTTGEDGTILSADTLQLDLDFRTQYMADTQKRYKVQFKNWWFANDEINLATNANGLLESVDLTVEDRTTQIIDRISDAPANILTSASKRVNFQMQEIDQQILEQKTVQVLPPFTRSIIWYPEQMDKPLQVEWTIPVPGSFLGPTPSADASFELRLDKPFVKPKKLPVNNSKEFGGVISRPFKSMNMTLHRRSKESKKAFDGDIAASYTVTLPDMYHSIGIPLKRSMFVKKSLMPKFANGLLIQNQLIKPSEIEAMLLIPINIGKAIFSIPAKLLGFNINHLQQQTSALTEQQKLLAAMLQLQKTQQEAGVKPETPNNVPQGVFLPPTTSPVNNTPPENPFRLQSLLASQQSLNEGEQRVISPAGYLVLPATKNLKLSHFEDKDSTLLELTNNRTLNLDDSWKLNCEWRNTTGSPIKYFQSTWIVPKPPKNNTNPQVIFLFNGLHSEEHLLQCVLQWGRSHIGGEKKWMIGCWHAKIGMEYPHYSKLVEVAPDLVLNAIITCEPTGAGQGNYKLYFDQFPDTTLEVDGLPILSTCCHTLEAYLMDKRDTDDYPASDLISFNNIIVKTQSRQVTPNWQPKIMRNNLGEYMQAVSYNQVNMYFRTSGSNNPIV